VFKISIPKRLSNKGNTKKLITIYGIPSFLSLLVLLFIWQNSLKSLLNSKEQIKYYKQNIEKYQEKTSELQKDIKKKKKEFENIENILKGQDAYIIISYIQNKIEKIPELSVRSFRIAKTIDKELYQIGTVNLVLEGDVKGLVKLLEELQNCKYPIRIKRLSVSYRRVRNRDQLNIVLEIQGLFLKT